MPTQEKIDAIEEIKGRIQKHQCVILTQYVGMKSGQATELRSQLRDKGVLFKVYKNNLGQRALEELNLAGAVPFLQGPTAWAFSESDAVAPSKVLKDFAKAVQFVAMRGGILEGKVVTGKDLEAIADLPPREQLIAQVVGVLAAPLRNLLGVLNATPRNFVSVLDQVRKQKEEKGEAA